MKNVVLGVLLVGLLVACSEEKKQVMVVVPDATVQCNPLLNTGCAANEKCTWLLDALMPQYVGHIGCAPAGTAALGAACMYGAPGETGYDDCGPGLVCSNFRGTSPGICKSVCDQQGGTPACDQSHVCVVYSDLFDLGESTPAAAGVCNVACNPFEDNDYDGGGADFTRTGTTCATDSEGCYGSPSYGTPPTTGFSCTRDIHYGSGSSSEHVHQSQCTVATGCADADDMQVYLNSCSQGYLPLLLESVGSSVTVCVAFCEPENCFEGNCGGAQNPNREGKTRASGPSHRCNVTDRLGTFDVTGTNEPRNGEHCQYLWLREVDNATSTFLPSQWSDKVGFCYDHTQYQYASVANGTPDTDLPPCAALKDGFGSGSDRTVPNEYFGAADLGCVDSTRLMVNGKVQIPQSSLEKIKNLDLPRPLYNRALFQPAD